MMKLDDWRQRLEDAGFRAHGALTEALARRTARADAVFVSLQDESGSPNQVLGRVRQMVATGVSVLLRVSNVRGGGEGVAELEKAREKARRALLGWTPPGAAGPVTFRRGAAVATDPSGVQWWQDAYECPQMISSTDD